MSREVWVCMFIIQSKLYVLIVRTSVFTCFSTLFSPTREHAKNTQAGNTEVDMLVVLVSREEVSTMPPARVGMKRISNFKKSIPDGKRFLQAQQRRLLGFALISRVSP